MVDWTGTIKFPHGPWEKTHEFTGKFGCKGLTIDKDGVVIELTGFSGVIPVPIFRKKWEPPEYYKGSGFKIKADYLKDLILYVDENSKNKYICIGGVMTYVAKVMRLKDLPDLEPGEEITL